MHQFIHYENLFFMSYLYGHPNAAACSYKWIKVIMVSVVAMHSFSCSVVHLF